MLLSSCFLSCTKQFISHSLIIQIYNLYCYGKLPRRVSAFGSFLHKHWGFFFYKFYGASFHKKSNFKVSVDFVSTWNFVHILQFIIKVTLSMVYLIFVSTFLKLNSKLHFLCIFWRPLNFKNLTRHDSQMPLPLLRGKKNKVTEANIIILRIWHCSVREILKNSHFQI